MNRLAREKSPYLRQHADNPVDWYPWGDEAFARARREDKPIFLSIGYSTCHWCHVMERESFAQPATAKLMNESFVNVKLDREERPDVDRVYMAFVQASTGGGGWPMSVFLTPSLEPFYGGTYFPPGDAHGRPGFPTLLARIAQLWVEKRPELVSSATNILKQIGEGETLPAPVDVGTDVGTRALQAFQQLFDNEYAGFGRAPKFPRPAVYDFLLGHFAKGGEEIAADMTLATLVLMARGGMYDHLGGGFHRYSVDRLWHVPHFEKMLYDQAQLVRSYVEGWQLTHDPELARIAVETCDYVLRDLVEPTGGGFYSAEDADSLPPGETDPHHKKEGAFYVWSKRDLDAHLGADADLFGRAYAVEDNGNAEDPHGELTGMNVLHAISTDAKLAEETGRQDVADALAKARATLFAVREKRARPSRDEKILAAWNGMMIGAMARAASALVEPRLLAAAQRAARFVTTTLWDGERLYRRWAEGETAIDAYLDDHAQLAAGLVDLYEADFDPAWLLLAEKLVDRAIARFADDQGGGFFATTGEDKTVLLRMKDDYDGAEPSGNAVMAMTMLRLAEMLDRPDLRERATGVFRAVSSRLKEIPHAVPALVAAWEFAERSPAQVVIAGDPRAADTQALLRVVRSRHLPHKVVLLADEANQAALGARLPWVAAMTPLSGRAAAYVCRNKTCDRPVTALADLASALPSRGQALP
jgi:uncharacterized protein